jgi:RHS repeat-associated protein
VGSLSKSGNSFAVSDEKSYDAWGGLRSGTNANGKAAYCANLGHKQDDESGLIYMRARYYEPTSGRFVNEDVAKDGSNWFVYCMNSPYTKVDYSGKNAVEGITWGILLGFIGDVLLNLMDGELGKFDWGKGARNAVIGGVTGYAVDWVKTWLTKNVPKISNAAKAGAMVTTGMGTIIATYYGIQMGRVLAALFWLELQDMGETLDGILPDPGADLAGP